MKALETIIRWFCAINKPFQENMKKVKSHKIRFGGGGVSVPARDVMKAEESTSRKINELWALRKPK